MKTAALLVSLGVLMVWIALKPHRAMVSAAAPTNAVTELRVCGDPNNLPFSNRAGEGFENRLAAMLAKDLGARVTYTWWPERRGFIRHTLDARTCDVVMGMPAAMEHVDTTRSYYRSTYVFLSPRRRQLHLRTLNDPRLHHLRIGVQMIGDDFANSPPAHALSARGIISNIVGYSVTGDYSKPNPPARIVEAVARGDIDVALAWGPLAGYFAARQPIALELTPVSPRADSPTLPFTFAISMAVRTGDRARLETLNRFIDKNTGAIQQLLHEFHVPLVDAEVHR